MLSRGSRSSRSVLRAAAPNWPSSYPSRRRPPDGARHRAWYRPTPLAGANGGARAVVASTRRPPTDDCSRNAVLHRKREPNHWSGWRGFPRSRSPRPVTRSTMWPAPQERAPATESVAQKGTAGKVLRAEATWRRKNGCNPLKGIERIATRSAEASREPSRTCRFRCNPLKGIERIATAMARREGVLSLVERLQSPEGD